MRSAADAKTEAAPALARAVELSVVIPTFKERGNVAELIKRLDHTLAGVAWEAIFVDDNSPDGTADAVKAIAVGDPRVRCLRRVGRRGLAGACIEGMLSSSAAYVAVMDADLQHDERILPQMLAKLQAGACDLVAASRYVEGGSAQSFSGGRGRISRLATRLTQRILGTSLSDPMSGFFMMRRDSFDAIAGRLSPAGFKILLDIATVGGGLRVDEQPFVFRSRHDGESKFNAQIGLEFLGLLLAKLSNGLVEPRFIFFAIVGASGIAVNLGVLKAAMLVWPGQASFTLAQSVATFFAMTSNFLLNNSLTYRDRRLRGWRMLLGFVGFCLIGTIGAVTNVGLASWLFYRQGEVWWLAGLNGAVMGVLWNYAMSSMFIWRTR
ncbi:MAG: glycosyltransferase family 2 protein [Alphaproteobacteria bacterium]|nr:glycosyltransferase family 2 protein [Alphaproteobacteria bacterium]